jgi:hypothetical protein
MFNRQSCQVSIAATWPSAARIQLLEGAGLAENEENVRNSWWNLSR